MNKKIIVYALDAGNGDCILIHHLENNKKILIDSGPNKGRGRILVPDTLKKILGKDNFIDLAILTHNDDDHIGGYKNLIEKEIIIVSKFIFNSSEYVKNIFPNLDKKYSYKQDIKLQELLDNTDIELLNFYNENNVEELSKYSFYDFEFNFLSPNEEKLKKFNKWRLLKEKEEGKKQPKKYSATSNIDCVSNDFNEILKEITNNDIFEEDTKAPNGSSLAFSLSIHGYNFLFLGDAHPSLIEEGMMKLENRRFDLCKLSHHGSKKNTSQSLLKTFECNNYLICSDGVNNHGHPSLYSIARVFINNSSSTFYFTSQHEKVLKFNEIREIKSKFPTDNYMRLEYEY